MDIAGTMEPRVWTAKGFHLAFDRTRVMGVVNVTPDSFSDGGRFFEPRTAIDRLTAIVEEGADVLDIGGESTRPGVAPVAADEEWRRIGPVLKAVARKVDIPISVDTYKPEVADKALGAGAQIVNDVRGLRDPAMVAVVKHHRAGAIVMHMQGEPRTMQENPRYHDVVHEVRAFLADRLQGAAAAGVSAEALVLDPGIGFGKRPEDNIDLLRNLEAIRVRTCPVMVGVSRKSFLGKIEGAGAADRLEASIAAAAFAVLHGADMVRAHDVLAHVRVARVLGALGLDRSTKRGQES